jgi:hypothetical protein
MRRSIAFGFALGVLALLTQNATAQFLDKKVLTLAVARKMVAAAEQRQSAIVWPAWLQLPMTADGRF